MKILALSGSLRSDSINSALLRAAARLAPPGITVTLFNGLGKLPLFNPDDEGHPPSTVAEFRSLVADADALLIASPEYAHGITGTIKNALDWLVSFEPFAYKPVAVLNASPRAHHADGALREVLRTMAAVIVEPASITIPLLGTKLDEDGMVSSFSVAGPIQQALAALCEVVALRVASTNASFPKALRGEPGDASEPGTSLESGASGSRRLGKHPGSNFTDLDAAWAPQEWVDHCALDSWIALPREEDEAEAHRRSVGVPLEAQSLDNALAGKEDPIGQEHAQIRIAACS